MRSVQLRYRVLRTDLIDGDQWYFGGGILFTDRETAEQCAKACTYFGLIADVEEYEIP